MTSGSVEDTAEALASRAAAERPTRSTMAETRFVISFPSVREIGERHHRLGQKRRRSIKADRPGSSRPYRERLEIVRAERKAKRDSHGRIDRDAPPIARLDGDSPLAEIIDFGKEGAVDPADALPQRLNPDRLKPLEV